MQSNTLFFAAVRTGGTEDIYLGQMDGKSATSYRILPLKADDRMKDLLPDLGIGGRVMGALSELPCSSSFGAFRSFDVAKDLYQPSDAAEDGSVSIVERILFRAEDVAKLSVIFGIEYLQKRVADEEDDVRSAASLGAVEDRKAYDRIEWLHGLRSVLNKFQSEAVATDNRSRMADLLRKKANRKKEAE